MIDTRYFLYAIAFEPKTFQIDVFLQSLHFLDPFVVQIEWIVELRTDVLIVYLTEFHQVVFSQVWNPFFIFW